MLSAAVLPASKCASFCGMRRGLVACPQMPVEGVFSLPLPASFPICQCHRKRENRANARAPDHFVLVIVLSRALLKLRLPSQAPSQQAEAP